MEEGRRRRRSKEKEERVGIDRVGEEVEKSTRKLEEGKELTVSDAKKGENEKTWAP